MLASRLRIDATSLSLVGALGAATCGPGPDAMDGGADGTTAELTTEPVDPTVSPPLPTTTGLECQDSGDCGSCSVCQDGLCMEDKNCCGGVRGFEMPCPYEYCAYDSECPDDEICVDEECVPPCYEDSDCFDGAVCVRGRCEVAGGPVIPLCPPARADVSSWMLTDSASDVALADLDGDGDLDVAAVGDGTLELAFNDGAGAFAPGGASDVGPPAPMGMQVVAADLDGDGDGELVIVDIDSGVLTVLRGDGGSFTVTGTVETLVAGQSLGAARVDGDAVDDIVAVAEGSDSMSTVAVLLGDGAGGLAPGIQSEGVAVGGRASFVDVTQDGVVDVTGRGALDEAIVFARGDGLGRFTDPAALAGSMGPWTSVLVGPLDGDALPDLVATRIEGAFGRVAVRLGVGPGSWGEVMELGGRHSAVGGVLADIDGDGLLDLVSASHQSPLISVLLGDGMGGFSCEQTYPGVTTKGAEQIAVGDIDGDGRAEIVAVERATTVVTVVRQP